MDGVSLTAGQMLLFNFPPPACNLVRVMAAAAAAVASAAGELAVLFAVGSQYVSEKKKEKKKAMYILMVDFLPQWRTDCITFLAYFCNALLTLPPIPIPTHSGCAETKC